MGTDEIVNDLMNIQSALKTIFGFSISVCSSSKGTTSQGGIICFNVISMNIHQVFAQYLGVLYEVLHILGVYVYVQDAINFTLTPIIPIIVSIIFDPNYFIQIFPCLLKTNHCSNLGLQCY